MIHLIDINSELYKQAIELRYELFFKEHALPKSIIFDNKEVESKHLAISEADRLIAYGRLTALSDSNYQISQMVVSTKYQSQGFGSNLLSELLNKAVSSGAKNITLNARLSALGLYQKYGFVKNGSVFKSESTGVPHVSMLHQICT
ncbi:MAG: GNAT family N-acetyltransferase [Colwellia sp.]|nr:GNAT family N-acetyltransferase [Colwellia sp.]